MHEVFISRLPWRNNKNYPALAPRETAPTILRGPLMIDAEDR
jgi:hypothetical protein